jgi:hypothetical protein
MAQEYKPGRFSDVAGSSLGREIWVLLNEHDNLVRMDTASELGRPAVEPLATRLVERFGDSVRERRVKQMIGHMARQIMEARGFNLSAQGVKVRTGDLFSTASRYRKVGEVT